MYTNEEIDKMTREERLEKLTLGERKAAFARGLDALLRRLSKKHNCAYTAKDEINAEEKTYQNGKVVAIKR